MASINVSSLSYSFCWLLDEAPLATGTRRYDIRENKNKWWISKVSIPTLESTHSAFLWLRTFTNSPEALCLVRTSARQTWNQAVMWVGFWSGWGYNHSPHKADGKSISDAPPWYPFLVVSTSLESGFYYCYCRTGSYARVNNTFMQTVSFVWMK